MKKKIYFILTLSAMLCNCSNNDRYLLKDSNLEKTYFSYTIKVLSKNGTISGIPLIVIDGRPFTYEKLITEQLQISKSEIINFRTLNKEIGMNLY